MNLSDAIAFIRPAVRTTGGIWADLGAGHGTFTEALAVVLGPTGFVLAVDRDPSALKALARLARSPGTRARVAVAAGDLEALGDVPELQALTLDGALFANALHYLSSPAPAVAHVAARTRPGGRIIFVEYDRDRDNRWVPYPLPVARLGPVARAAGLGQPQVVARRPSAYQGQMYCAVAELPSVPTT